MSFLFSAGAVDVIPDSVIDNFEASLYEDESRGLSDVYGGDTSPFSRQQSVVQEGSYALEGGNTGTNVSSAISDTDTLDSLSQGESVEVYTRGESTSASTRGPSGGFAFAVQSEAGISNISCYTVAIQYRYDKITIRRIDNGSVTALDASSVTLPSQTWHRTRVDWEANNDIRVRGFDGGDNQIHDVTVNDGNYTSGGVGWVCNSDDRDNTGAMWFDAALKL